MQFKILSTEKKTYSRFTNHLLAHQIRGTMEDPPNSPNPMGLLWQNVPVGVAGVVVVEPPVGVLLVTAIGRRRGIGDWGGGAGDEMLTAAAMVVGEEQELVLAAEVVRLWI